MSGITETQFNYIEAVVVNETTGREIDVKHSIAELDLYEDLGNLGTSGRILIVDSQNIFQRVNMTGVETLRLQIKSEQTGKVIKKNYVMTATLKADVVNDSTIAYVFELQEPHIFQSKIQKISKAYTGTPIQIIGNILTGILNKELDKDLIKQDIPAQEAMSVVIPYLNPVAAIQWIRNRLTTEDGLPYFFYGTLRSDKIIVNSLQHIQDAESPFKKKYTYGGAQANSGDPAKQIMSIEKIQNTASNATLAAVTSGAIGGRYEVLDTVYGTRNSESQFKVSEYYTGNLYDKDFKINDKLIDEYESAITFDLVAPTYSQLGFGYGYNPEVNKLKTKAARRSFLAALQQNSMQVQVNGFGFFGSEQATVGCKMPIEVIQLIDDQRIVDEKKTGNFIVTNTKHSFRDNQHIVSARVTKYD